MDYREAVHYLLEQLPMFQRVGAAAYRADLGNIIALCEIMDNPQRGTKFIHIAGTNGKGSVSHIIASILQAQGYKVGLFVSPHYKDYRERIKINGKFITKPFIAKFVSENMERFKSVNASFFEITTAMAFAYFKAMRVDYAVIETGMGGRLDSTNIITPLLSVITNISYDHTQFLGDTLPKIAVEKAGIIKQNIPVVIGETNRETKEIFIKASVEKHSQSTFADKEIKLYDFKSELKGISFSYNNKKYRSDVSGNYQSKNITTALAAIYNLKAQGITINESALKKGLSSIKPSTYFIGRWMVMGAKPLIVFDSAHNKGGIKELVSQIKQISYKRLHFVYGAVADKDISHILSILPKKATFYFCKPDIPRGKEADALQHEAIAHKLNGETYYSVKKAYKAALTAAQPEDLIIVSGSIFVVAELL